MPNLAPLSSLAEVRRFLESLPPVSAGRRRVLRGQTRLFDTVRPSRMRTEHDRHHLFKVAAKKVLDQLATESNGVADYFVWTEVVSQHYGPGSNLLDVTQNLEVALWFASHSIQRQQQTIILGAPGPIDPAHDVLFDFGALHYRAEAEDGYLLVFDVAEAERPEAIAHGKLLDLQNAPASLVTSLRVQRQHGMVISASASDDDGDLSEFLACEPVPVAARVAAELDTDLSFSNLFPGPRSDPWYRALLSIPLVIAPIPETHAAAMIQPVPVTIWAESAQQLEEVTDPIISLSPPTLIPDLQLPGGNDVTLILVEEPLFSISPEICSEQWLDEDAVEDLPIEAEVRGSTPHSTVSLAKVYFEFSPLDFSGWHEIERNGGTCEFRAGAYLERKGSTFFLWTIDRTIPAGPRIPTGPIEFEIDPSSHKFIWRSRTGAIRDPRAEIPWALKTLLVCLVVLRDLSTRPIPSAYAKLQADDVFVSPLVGGRELEPMTLGGCTVYLSRAPGKTDVSPRRLLEYGIQVRARPNESEK